MTVNTPSISLRTNAFGFSTTSVSGHAARSMMFSEISALFRALPLNATRDDFTTAVVENNVLGKATLSSRKNSLSHLIELYGLDRGQALFRVLWDLAHADGDSLAELCLVCAYARDPQLRLSFELIRSLRPGEVLDRVKMEQHLENGFPGRFSPILIESIAQHVNTTWTVAGHLVGRVKKVRRLPEPRPVSAAYAMFVGYLTGLRGERLLESDYAALVSSNRSQLQAALSLASARRLISLKQAAEIVEFDFSNLLTPAEQAQLHESH
jgi:hypothetical protein